MYYVIYLYTLVIYTSTMYLVSIGTYNRTFIIYLNP